ncbi:glycosyltransferase involved in cell wall biosynthesis [Pseudomonas sp. W3I7]|uniref:glycosyltransferase n=1 Tax=Pseudomonas sp. W3I7 TaxID=3042292 RepID=UPI00278F5722|nr:glycosyltransferase [Pseudomonas sp. W3I7]MDQ0702538.1 glycosyltransferase involved in cell wall biosynthesis [Pseudomonas sp. W3I7]
MAVNTSEYAGGDTNVSGTEVFKRDYFSDEDKLGLLNFLMQEFGLEQPLVLKGADAAVSARFIAKQYSLRGKKIDLLLLDAVLVQQADASVAKLFELLSGRGLVCVESKGAAPEVLNSLQQAFEPILTTPGFSIFAKQEGERSVRSARYQVDLFLRKLHFQKSCLIAKGPEHLPLVTVVVLTYKHEAYIAECINSVLRQKGAFRMRIIVIDDVSPDNTAQVVRSTIENQQNDRISIEFHANTKNVGVVANLATSVNLAKGCDYLTFCEGDDFWTSDTRIQQHIDFLAKHPESVMSFNSIELCVSDGSSREIFSEHKQLASDTISGLELAENNVIGNFTACFYRGPILDVIPAEIFDIYTVDWFFNTYCAQFGSIAHLKQPLSVYRQHIGGEWSARKELDKATALLGLIDEYNAFIDFNYNEGYQKYNWKLYAWVNGNYSDSFEKLDLIVVDDVFPSRRSGFRHVEFTAYLKAFKRSLVLTTGATLHVLENASINSVVRDYQHSYPELGNRVMVADESFPLTIGKVLYANFISNAFSLLPHAEALNIPFVFTLYPGAGFALNSIECDKKLKRIFDSPCFQKVIVTQQVIYNYITEKHLCPADKIEMIFGVVMPEPVGERPRLEKNRWGFGKERLDICFMAHKYTTYGEDKGYDVFINTASILCQRYDNIFFHVVGPFNKTVIDVSLFSDRIKFHGSLNPDEFDGFFQDMDIIMSPNISGKIFPGSFDGFPTASCTEAALRGTAIFAFDEFNSAKGRFTDGEDIVLIKYDLWDIVGLVEKYHADPAALKAVGEAGIDRVRALYSYDAQLAPRIEILREVIRNPVISSVSVDPLPLGMQNVVPANEGVQQVASLPVASAPRGRLGTLRKYCPEPLKKVYRLWKARHVS